MAILVQDDFTDVDNTSLSSHTPTPNGGAAWIGGTAAILSNRVPFPSLPSSNAVYNTQVMPDNHYVSATIGLSTTGHFSSPALVLCARIQNINNYYGLLIYRFNETNTVRVWIVKVVNGIVTGLLQSGYADAQQIISARLEIQGTLLSGSITGLWSGSVVDTTFSSGKVGFSRIYGAGPMAVEYLDDFEAGTLAPSAPTNLTLACGV